MKTLFIKYMMVNVTYVIGKDIDHEVNVLKSTTLKDLMIIWKSPNCRLIKKDNINSLKDFSKTLY